MTKTEIINIGRDLILKAGLLKKPTDTQKQQFLKLLNNYEKQLENEDNKYVEVILGFIHDIRGDIEEGREINIDTIKDDEYVENYFIIKHELDNFNNLINEDVYEDIFDELRKKSYEKKDIAQLVKKLETQFRAHFKQLSSKNIAKNLLIFTLFERKLPMPALKRLHTFLIWHNDLWEEANVINELKRDYTDFLTATYVDSKDCYKKITMNYKFIRYTHDETTKQMKMWLSIEDACKWELRSGNAKFEYWEILKKMR